MSDLPPECVSRPSLLEVIALTEVDALRAQDGGADRIELVGTMDADGLSPTVRLVERVCSAVHIDVRVMVRVRPGFAADAAERSHLRALAAAFLEAGASGLVVGFLDADGAVDVAAFAEVAGGSPCTFHRAFDHAADPDAAWTVVRGLVGVDQVLTAGSARGVGEGLSVLSARASSDADAAGLIMAGGGLMPHHVAELREAGVRAFHIGSGARPAGRFRDPVDPDAVSRWRILVDA